MIPHLKILLLTMVIAMMTASSGFCLPNIKLSLGGVKRDFETAELHFHNVLHTRNSYEVRVFLNHPNADTTTPIEDNKHYAGSLFFYGQGDYIDPSGEILSNRDPRAREFDLSPGASNTSPFPLYLDITESLRQLVTDGSEVTVTFVAIDQQGNPITNPDFTFESLSLVAD